MDCSEQVVNLEKGLGQPLLLNSTENEEDEEGDEDCDTSEEASEDSRRPANSLGSAYRLLTPSVKVHHIGFGKLNFISLPSVLLVRKLNHHDIIL